MQLEASAESAGSNTWWFDVTSLFSYLRFRGRRLSGIPRVMVELISEGRRSADASRIKLVRFDDDRQAFVRVTWDQYDGVISGIADNMGVLRKAIEWSREHYPIALKLYASAKRVVKSISRRRTEASNPVGKANADDGRKFHPFSSGDVWVSLGSWWVPDLLKNIISVKDSGVDIKSAVMIYDCIPLIHPELCTREAVTSWAAERQYLEKGTDLTLVISEQTDLDVQAQIASLKAPTARVRLGDMFIVPSKRSRGAQSKTTSEAGRPYVLMVGTIEPRKNHILALRAWDAMRKNLGADLPDLVFAGRWGWNVDAVREMILETRNLDGLVRIVESPSDKELAALYRGALFTLYPSLYEGWGLPVRESIYYGKICVAARNSAIVEAGGALAVYFDNNHQKSLVETVTSLIRNPDRISLLERNIAEEFEPAGWEIGWAQLSTYLERSLRP